MQTALLYKEKMKHRKSNVVYGSIGLSEFFMKLKSKKYFYRQDIMLKKFFFYFRNH